MVVVGVWSWGVSLALTISVVKALTHTYQTISHTHLSHTQTTTATDRLSQIGNISFSGCLIIRLMDARKGDLAIETGHEEVSVRAPWRCPFIPEGSSIICCCVFFASSEICLYGERTREPATIFQRSCTERNLANEQWKGSCRGDKQSHGCYKRGKYMSCSDFVFVGQDQRSAFFSL